MDGKKMELHLSEQRMNELREEKSLKEQVVIVNHGKLNVDRMVNALYNLEVTRDSSPKE